MLKHNDCREKAQSVDQNKSVRKRRQEDKVDPCSHISHPVSHRADPAPDFTKSRGPIAVKSR